MNDSTGRQCVTAHARVHSTDEWTIVTMIPSAELGSSTIDWSLIGEAGTRGKPWILAGGLGPDNIAEAAGRFRPFAVDLSSGAETDGWKDPVKMEQCVRAVRNARSGGKTGRI